MNVREIIAVLNVFTPDNGKWLKNLQVLLRFELSLLRRKSRQVSMVHSLKQKPYLYLALEMSVVNEVYIGAFLGAKITHCFPPVKVATPNQCHVLWKVFHKDFARYDFCQR